MNKLLTEFLGTLFLVLTIGCTVIAPVSGVIAPLAIGFVLMAMIYAGGHISGAHYNPAVTLAAIIRGRCTPQNAVGYVAAQVAGALVAAFAVIALKGSASTAAVIPVGPALLAEFLYTFALVYVVLSVATAKGTAGNSFYGLAIGGTVMVGAFSVGSISGAVFNPAVAIGVATMGLVGWGGLWVYLVANFAAAVSAAIAFKIINPNDK